MDIHSKSRRSRNFRHTWGAVQKASINWDTVMKLRTEIVELLSTRLSDSSMMVIQDQIDLMHKGFFYLEMHRHDLPPPADQQEPHQPAYMSSETLVALIDHQRLQRMQRLATSHVNIKLTLLDELYLQIIQDSRELEAFVNQHPGLVNCSTLPAVQETHRRAVQALDDFDRMLEPSPLHMKHQIFRTSGHISLPRISLSVVIKMPVMFDRYKSHVTSSSVDLHWQICEGPQEEEQEFEIHFELCHLSTGDQDQTGKVTCGSYSTQINKLTPDRDYKFSVKRVDVSNLVYGMWMDTLTLHTKAGPALM